MRTLLFLVVFWFGRNVFLDLPNLTTNEWIIFVSVLCSFAYSDFVGYVENKDGWR